MKKKLALALVVVLAFALGVGGTVAYLTAETNSITNTFVVGNIKIDLTETFNTDLNDQIPGNDAWQNKLIPGNTYTKDPTVTVKANSEPCYLFLKVESNANWEACIDYTLNTTIWTADTAHPGYYYRVVDTSTEDQNFNVLTSNAVTVKTSVTQTMMDSITTENAPAITFKAAAVQSANINTVTDAWAQLPSGFTA